MISQDTATTMEFTTISKSLNFNLHIKLTKSNYLYWKTQVLPIIQALELEDHLLGLNQPSRKFVNVEVTTESGEKLVEQRISKEFSNWKRIDKLLMSWIYSTISENIIGQVVGSQTSFEVWGRLERTYSQQSMAKILQLKNQLGSLKKGAYSISDYVLKIKNIGDSLLAAGEDVRDRDLVMCLMNGVGHDYDTIVSVISTQQRFISFEDASYLLMTHEQRLEHLDSPTQVEGGQISANYSSNYNQERRRDVNIQSNRGGQRGRGRNNNNRFGGRGRIHCQVCNKPGHSALKCYHRFDHGFQRPSQQQN